MHKEGPKMNSMIKNNKGFSLIELIVTVLITSILMLGVIAFMSTSRSAYQNVNISSTLQEESLTVKRVLTEYLMESKAYGLQKNVTIDGNLKDVLWIVARETEDNTYINKAYFFVIDPVDKKIRFCKGNSNLVNPDVLESLSADAPEYILNNCYNDGGKYSVVAEHVQSLTLTKSEKRPDNSYLVCIKLKYQYPEGNGREFYDEIAVVTRNHLASSSSGSGESGSGEGGSGGGVPSGS